MFRPKTTRRSPVIHSDDTNFNKRTEASKRVSFVPPTCDANFNNISEILRQATFARFILENQNNNAELFSFIEALSHKTKTLLSNGVLDALMKNNAALSAITFLLSPENNDLGSMPAKCGLTISKYIKATLDTKVNSSNWLAHFKLHLVFATVIVKTRMVNDFAAIKTSGLYTKMLRNVREDADTKCMSKDLDDCIERLFPKKCDMENARQYTVRKSKDKKSRNIKPASVYGTRFPLTLYYYRHYIPVVEDKEPALKRPIISGLELWQVKRDQATRNNSKFIDDCCKYNIPIIAGESGSTARWLVFLIFTQVFDPNDESAKQYLSLIVCYFVYCRCHSAAEVIQVLKKIDKLQITESELDISKMKSAIHPGLYNEEELNKELSMLGNPAKHHRRYSI